MKKIWIPILFCICFLVGCHEKIVPAELKVYDVSGNETVLTIQATDNAQEITDLLKRVDEGYLAPYSFSTVQMDMNMHVGGAVSVDLNQKKTDIDLDYQINNTMLLHFKEFRLKGSVEIKGSDHTTAVDFTSHNQNHLMCDYQNDDEFLYLNGAFLVGENKVNLQGKTAVDFLQQYKGFVASLPELIRHQKLTYFLGDIEMFVNAYQLSIVHTTKDSFTLRLSIPASQFDSQNVLTGVCNIEIEISCQSFLPISFSISGDDLIEELLKTKYIEKYLTEQVSISKASLEWTGHITYGNETLSLLSEAEKEKYSEFDWKSILDQFNKYI